MEWARGTIIAGRYRVDRRVGTGGMGEVWRGENTSTGTPVAMKTLLPAAAVNHEVVARFKREAYFLGRLQSEHVARILDFVTDDAHGLVLVMEYVEGESLAQVLQKRRLGFDEAVEVATDVATALCELHKAHIVHRDLKPGNVILRQLPDGTKRAVIVDFGVSRMLSDQTDEETLTGITKADMALGTLEYMAPEQVLNSRDVTQASDVYALGAMMFRAVVGRHIFGNVTDEILARKKLLEEAPAFTTGRTDAIAQDFEAVISKAIKRRPSERYPRADELLEGLAPVRDALRASHQLIDASTTEDTKRVPLSKAPPPHEDIAEVTANTYNTMVDAAPRVSVNASLNASANASASAEALPLSRPTPPSSQRVAPVSLPTPVSTTLPERAPDRRGISALALLVAVLVAAGGGVLLGRTLGSDSAAGPAAGAPTASEVLPAPSVAALPAATAAPNVAAEADDTVIIQDLDPASAAALGLVPGGEAPAAGRPLAAAPKPADRGGDPEPSIDDDSKAAPGAAAAAPGGTASAPAPSAVATASAPPPGAAAKPKPATPPPVEKPAVPEDVGNVKF
jgi:serine/threonine protein kinase